MRLSRRASLNGRERTERGIENENQTGRFPLQIERKKERKKERKGGRAPKRAESARRIGSAIGRHWSAAASRRPVLPPPPLSLSLSHSLFSDLIYIGALNSPTSDVAKKKKEKKRKKIKKKKEKEEEEERTVNGEGVAGAGVGPEAPNQYADKPDGPTE